MDTTSSTKKLQSFESYKNQFLYSLTLHSLLIALTCSLLSYFLSWFLPLPNSLSTSLLTPKCLFIIVNIIVMFLVGESRLSGSNSSISPSTQIYDEYVERSWNFRSFQQQIKPVINTLTSEEKEVIELPQEEVKEVVQVVQEQSDEKEVETEEIKEVAELENDDNVNVDEEEKGNCVEEEGSECGLPAEELNRRVEEFIARVNKQRWLEARFLVCCEA